MLRDFENRHFASVILEDVLWFRNVLYMEFNPYVIISLWMIEAIAHRSEM